MNTRRNRDAGAASLVAFWAAMGAVSAQAPDPAAPDFSPETVREDSAETGAATDGQSPASSAEQVDSGDPGPRDLSPGDVETGDDSAAVAAQLPPVEPLDVVQREPWPSAPAPASAQTVLLRRAHRVYFGLTPGSFSEAQGLAASGTGVSRLAVDTEMGLYAFGGGAWGFEHLDAVRTLRVDLLGRARMGVQRQMHDDPNATLKTDATGYDLDITLERGYAEYLHYLPGTGFGPLFVGVWGGAPGTSISVSRPTQERAKATKTVALPLEFSVGMGIGRVYPVRGRVVLARMQEALLLEGVLDRAIPHDVALRILSQWYADRDHLRLPFDHTEPHGWSYHRQLLSALQILADEELLLRPIHLLTAYRLDRILLDENNLDRWVGWELRAGVRTIERIERQWFDGTQTKLDTAAAFALEVRAEAFFNLTVDSDLQIAPSIGMALRDDDVVENDLSGARRVQLAAGPAIDATGAFIPDGRVVLDVPITYRRYVYDQAQNLAGTWNLHTGVSGGWRNSEAAVGLSFGAAYTIFSDSQTGYTLGLDGGMGHVGGAFEYQVGVVAVIGLGTGETFYTAPDQVGDVVPFDTTWIPKPAAPGSGEVTEASP